MLFPGERKIALVLSVLWSTLTPGSLGNVPEILPYHIGECCYEPLFSQRCEDSASKDLRHSFGLSWCMGYSLHEN